MLIFIITVFGFLNSSSSSSSFHLFIYSGCVRGRAGSSIRVFVVHLFTHSVICLLVHVCTCSGIYLLPFIINISPYISMSICIINCGTISARLSVASDVFVC